MITKADGTIFPALAPSACPKCGVEMELIDVPTDELPMQQLELCPSCYLVTWKDEQGFQCRQGVPMKPGGGQPQIN